MANIDTMIELTEIKKTGILWWKKLETNPLFLNKNHIESLRNRKGTGTEIETNRAMYEVRESIIEVFKLLN